jgi:hypothetical protein
VTTSEQSDIMMSECVPTPRASRPWLIAWLKDRTAHGRLGECLIRFLIGQEEALVSRIAQHLHVLLLLADSWSNADVKH